MQFKAYYDLDNDKIIEIMKQKINRQLDRIEKENKKWYNYFGKALLCGITLKIDYLIIISLTTE